MNENNDKKKLTETDRRNWLQEIFHELRGIKLDAHAFRFYKLGYVMSSFIEDNVSDKDKLSNRYTDPRQSFDYLTKILEEWEPIKDDEEFDLNELLESLKAELGEEDESPEPVSEEELDEFISKLEQESPPPKAIPPPNIPFDIENHIKKNSKRYEEIFYAICKYVTDNCDAEIMQIDSYEDEQWKYASVEEVKREKDKLQQKIQAVADHKARELLGPDPLEKQCFNLWLKRFRDDGGPHGAGSEWWKVPME